MRDWLAAIPAGDVGLALRPRPLLPAVVLVLRLPHPGDASRTPPWTATSTTWKSRSGWCGRRCPPGWRFRHCIWAAARRRCCRRRGWTGWPRCCGPFRWTPTPRSRPRSTPANATPPGSTRCCGWVCGAPRSGCRISTPRVQAAIGREQGADLTAGTVAALRERGVSSVNFDLLYGLPHQTPAALTATLDAALAMGPDRIALYGYAHVPWMARRQQLIPEAALPAPEARLALAERGARAASGGRLCRHRHRPFRPPRRQHGPGCRRGPAAPQFPGLHHRRRRKR